MYEILAEILWHSWYIGPKVRPFICTVHTLPYLIQLVALGLENLTVWIVGVAEEDDGNDNEGGSGSGGEDGDDDEDGGLAGSMKSSAPRATRKTA